MPRAKNNRGAWSTRSTRPDAGPRGYPPDLAARQTAIIVAIRTWGARLPLVQRDALRVALETTTKELDDLDKPIII